MVAEDSLRRELEARLQFETLIADLSSKFINLPAAQVDREIEDDQRQVCECLGLDLAALWQWSAERPHYFTLTHLYRPLGGPPPRERMDAQEMFPWCLQQLLAGKVVSVSSMAALPPEAVRDQAVWQHYGVKSALVFPLSAGGGKIIGAWGFHTLREERTWSEGIVKRLQLVAQVFTNALARKRSEEILRESEARLSLATDAAGAGLWIMTLATEQVWVTPRTRELFQFLPEEDLTYQRFFEVIHPEDRDLVRRGVTAAAQAGVELNVEYRLVLPDGNIRWVVSRGGARPSVVGKPDSVMGVTLDITERKQAEEALRQSHAEIERLKDRLQAESEYLKAEVKLTQAYGEFVGRGAGIRRVLSQVEQVAPTDSSVLIHGETGTGKELIAQAIHRLSARRSKVMVKVNCAALPSALVESELFGREKGAFTGALTRQIGRFEVADGSTIFLDEIGELSLEVQAKLLGVLQEGQFERLGSPRSIKVNVRVIAATNRDLAAEIRKGRFREDLYYRLNVFPIWVPPLRERAEDIPQLVWAFLKEFSSRVGKKINQVPRRTMEALQRHPWPGNVRELRNVIEHGVIVTTGETLKVPLLEAVVPAAEPPQTLADTERAHIVKALERSGWRIKGPKGAAATLGLNPSTLYSRMQKHGIPHRRQKESGAG